MAIGVVVGFVFGHLGSQLFQVTVKNEVGWGEIFNFTITLIFAFVLQNYLQKRFGDDRAEKEHIIDLIKEALGFLKNLRGAFYASYEKEAITSDDAKQILALLRNFINSVTDLKGLLKECGYTGDSYDCKAVEDLYRDYKRAITGGNFPTQPYDGKIYSEAEMIYYRLVQELHKIRININRR